ncbi:hypothetical protein BGW39_010942 [Mortierella sp. 14UC]|nr:hypothetical protein BGW39_010942 [Mortierella sp. 14UC]
MMRFLVPWLAEEPARERSEETEEIDVDQPLDSTSAHNILTEDAEAVEEENTHHSSSISNDQENGIEIIEESDPVAIIRTEDSQATLITSSQEAERNFTPEGSFMEESVADSVADVSEDLVDIARRMEREESLVSGLESDAGVDRKESKRSSRKRDSRQSTPVRTTRRSTRSQASKLEEEIIIREETITTTITQENVVLNELQDEPSEITAEPAQEPQETTSKSGKRKKKSKRGSKHKANEDVEELEQELIQTDARIADKIQKSQDLIDASEKLLHRSDLLDEQAEQVLADSKDQFTSKTDDEESAQREDDEDQTFHSTKQFDPVDATEELGEAQEPLYPVLDEEDTKFYPDDEEDDQENADTVKYYPSESPAATGPIDVDMEDDVHSQAQEVDREQEQESEEEQEKEEERLPQEQVSIAFEPPSRNPSPPAATLSSASPLREGEEVAFSPMVLSRSPTPSPAPSTPPPMERFEDSLPSVTPKAEQVKPKSTIEDALPMSNLEFLAEFFKEQKGRSLTRAQADHCQQLIEEAVRPFGSSSKRLSVGGVSSSSEGLATVLGHASPITTHTAIVPDQINMQEPIAAPIVNVASRITKRAAPFEIKRQAISDLYHEGRRETAHRPALPPLDEYLEIKKYEGVDWDDLPNQVKVKRLLEWKGTEAPEVLKRRKIEERRLMKEKNAEVWGRDKKDESSIKGTSALKRTATSSGMFSDDDDEEEPLQHKKSSAALGATAVAATTAAVTKEMRTADTHKVSSVAQKLLDIVGKGSKATENAGEEAAKKSVVKAVDSVSETVAKSLDAPTVPAVASPFNFGLASTTKESAPEASKPTFSFGKSDASAMTTEPSKTSEPSLAFGTTAETGSVLEKVSSGSIFAMPATATPRPVSALAPPASKPLYGSLSSTPAPSSTGFSFSTPASDTKVAPKPQSNFGVAADTPSASSSSVTTTPLFSFGSSSTKEPTTTTTSTTTKTTTSPFGATPSFPFGTTKSPSAENSNTSPFGSSSTLGFSFGAPKSPTAEKIASSSFGAAASGFSFGAPKSPTTEKSMTSPFATASGFGAGLSFGGPKSPTETKSTAPSFGAASSFSFGVSKSPSAEKTMTSTTTTPSTFPSSTFSSFGSAGAASKSNTTSTTFNFGVTPGAAAAGAFGGAAAASTLAHVKFGDSTGPASTNPFAAITSLGLKPEEKKKEEEPEVILLSDEEDGDDGDDDEGRDEDYTGDEDQYDDDEDNQQEGTGSYEGEGDEYSHEDSFGEEDDYGDEDNDADDSEDIQEFDNKAKAVQAASKAGGMFNFAPSANPFGQAFSSSTTTSIFNRPAPKSPQFDFTFGSSSRNTTTATAFGGASGGFGGFSGFSANSSSTSQTAAADKSRMSSDRGDISDFEMSPMLTYRAGSADSNEGEISPLSSPVLGPQH